MSKNAFRFLTILIFPIICIFAVASFGQNPQTQTAPPYATNAKYANGVAPGYWVQQLYPTIQTGLVLNVSQGAANCGSGVITAYSGGTLTMTASTTNYIYLNTSASCVPAVKTTAFTANDIPIAVVVTGSGSITSINDVRTQFNAPASVVSGVSSFNTRTGAVVLATSDVNGLGTLSNPTTGNAATSTDLASYPTLCSGGQFSQGLSHASNNCGTPSGGGGGSAGVVGKTASYTLVSGDSGVTFSFSSTGTLTATLPGTNPGLTWWTRIINNGSQNMIIAPNGLSLDGFTANENLAPRMSVFIGSDASNYFSSQGGILTSTSSNAPYLVQAPAVGNGFTATSTSGVVSGGSCVLLDDFHDDSSSNVVTDNQGNVYTEYNYQEIGGAFDYSTWIATNVIGGPLTITSENAITKSVVYEYANCGGVDVVNSQAEGIGGDMSSATLATGNITTTEALDLIHVTSGVRAAAVGVWSETAGYTKIVDSGFAFDLPMAAWDQVESSTGTFSDTLTYSDSLNIEGIYSSIIALKPSTVGTAFEIGDLTVGGVNGQLGPVHPGTAGYCWISNGPGAQPSYRPCGGTGGGSAGIVLINGVNPGFVNISGMQPFTCIDASESGTAQACTSTTPTNLYWLPTTLNCFTYEASVTNSGTALTLTANTVEKPVGIWTGSTVTTTLTANEIPASLPLLVCDTGSDYVIEAPALGSGGITQLIGDATAGPGSGSQSVVVGKINGVALAGLATGLLKNTTSTGVPSIAASGSDYVVPTGNVATATDLATYPTACSGGQFSQGLSHASNNCGTPSGGGGCMTPIVVTLGSAAATITAASIPATCNWLRITATLQATAEINPVEVTFNGDPPVSTSHYSNNQVQCIGSTCNSITSQTGFLNAPNELGTASPGGFVIDVPGYALTTLGKTAFITAFGSNTTPAFENQNGAGNYTPTTAISSVTVTASTSTFIAGSTLTITGQ